MPDGPERKDIGDPSPCAMSAFPGYSRTLARLVAGKNIEPETLLATDYLNHFNEIVMLLEILPDIPDCLEDVRQWQPKSYQDHFRDSVFADKDLAIFAYENAPARYREPFDDVVRQLNELVAASLVDIEQSVAGGDSVRLAAQCGDTVERLGLLVDKASAIIHGHTDTVDQETVDSLLK